MGGADVRGPAFSFYVACAVSEENSIDLALGCNSLSFNFFKDMPNGIFASVCFVIAKYSYGIYLLHVPAMYIAFVVLSHLPAAIQWLALCILMAVLPWLACRFVEEPMISVGRLLGARVTREHVSGTRMVETQQ